VVYVSEHFGWDILFYFLGGAAFLAGAVLMPMWNLKPSVHIDIPLGDKALQPTA
jgi:sugar phosphate permease